MKFLFKPSVLNIFADASIIKDGDNYISCAGTITVSTLDNFMPYVSNTNYSILENCSNNRGELYAIYLAVNEAIRNIGNYNTINIISDSQFSIYGLRTWIIDWVKRVKQGKYYSKSGKEVANQDLLNSIINNIISNNLYVNLYHQKGHCKDIDKCKQRFFKSNCILLDDYECEMINHFNNQVDLLSRDKLEEYRQAVNLNLMLKYGCDFDINLYSTLVNVGTDNNLNINTESTSNKVNNGNNNKVFR